MKIDRALLDKIAHLSRLEFDEKDAEKVMKDMSEIVDWVEKLNEVNTDGIEPLIYISEEYNVLREDEVHQEISQKAADLNYAAAVLGWDQETYMPPKGYAARGRQLATLATQAHAMLTSDEYRGILHELSGRGDLTSPPHRGRIPRG